MSDAPDQPARADERTDEAAFAWAPKDEIAIRMEKHRSVREENRQIEAARRVRRRLRAVALVILLALAVYFAWYYRRRLGVKEVGPAPPGVSLRLDPQADFLDYKLKRGSLTFPDGSAYELRRFEFDSNRFLSGHVTLDNADKFRAAIASDFFKQELKDSWVIIFAGASFDGKADGADGDTKNNQRLCRDRVQALAGDLRGIQGLAPKGIWGVAAGEKALDPPVSEKDEDDIAKKMPEEELRGQRVLIIISVRGGGPQGGTNPQDFIRRLYPFLYQNGLLPKDYDAREAEPAPINSPPG